MDFKGERFTLIYFCNTHYIMAGDVQASKDAEPGTIYADSFLVTIDITHIVFNSTIHRMEFNSS
jgi:hypothetical protein